jgi:tRNA dimethylallyltransferase
LNQPSGKIRIVVICGPTGVGKTRFAIALARRFGAQIVGADSMQIYRRMDIGTAKPTAQETSCVRHHMVDIIEPDQNFDAAAYARQAHDCIRRLAAEETLPFVVGGTGLYIKSLIYGLSDAAPADAAVRRQLQAQMERSGSECMHRELMRLDPVAGRRIHSNDRYRIVRALEVYISTGRSIVDHHRTHGFRGARFHALTIGLTMPRKQLYDRINRRVDIMLAQGLKDEVQRLLDLGYSERLKSMQSLGYRHIIAHLRHGMKWSQMVEALKRDHRRYAKRQLTWFGAVDGIRWLFPDQIESAAQWINGFLSDAHLAE